MRIFVDLGAHYGNTIEIALKKYKQLDRVYAFEPLAENFRKLVKKFRKQKNIILINAAADTVSGEKKLYYGKEWGDLGGSLVEGKTTCYRDKFEMVKSIDFSNYAIKNFKKNKIILKIDIEGKEYEVLDKMMRDGSIKYINEIYVEWHYDRINKDFETHQKFIKQLRNFGFNLSGVNYADEFIRVSHLSKTKLQLKRWGYYYKQQLLTYLKSKFPHVYFCLEKVSANRHKPKHTV